MDARPLDSGSGAGEAGAGDIGVPSSFGAGGSTARTATPCSWRGRGSVAISRGHLSESVLLAQSTA